MFGIVYNSGQRPCFIGRRAAAALLLLLLVLFPGAAALYRSAFSPAVRPLRITFLDVGQGDSTVIEGPTGRVVVVDGGGHPGTNERDGRDPGSRVVVPFLRSRGIGRIDLLVPTHPDDDHVQGLNAVVNSLSVDAALDGGYPGDSAPYRRLQENLARHRIPVFLARRGQVIDLGGGAHLQVCNPPDHALPGARSPTNNNSIVLRLVYGRARVLLTGDAEEEAESEMLATIPDLSADVYKAGHHGSRWSSTAPFLARVHPAVVIVSCGAGNLYGHPARDTLERCAAIGARVLRTDQQGAITLETDGQRIRFQTMH